MNGKDISDFIDDLYKYKKIKSREIGFYPNFSQIEEMVDTLEIYLYLLTEEFGLIRLLKNLIDNPHDKITIKEVEIFLKNNKNHIDTLSNIIESIDRGIHDTYTYNISKMVNYWNYKLLQEYGYYNLVSFIRRDVVEFIKKNVLVSEMLFYGKIEFKKRQTIKKIVLKK